MKLTKLEFYLEFFNLLSIQKTRKTSPSYEQSLKLFILYLKSEYEIVDPSKVKAGQIRQYMKYIQGRAKYTVVGNEKSRK
ncbi:hypothetical protein [Bacillus cereus]